MTRQDYILDNFHKVQNNIANLNDKYSSKAKLLVVSKTFPTQDILPLLEAGHRDFAENKVQEAQDKWVQLKQDYPDIRLHLIGALQSNKVKQAMDLFDVIHTIDREKIARKIFEQKNNHIKLFVQVNTGDEEQKAGVNPLELANFLKNCFDSYNITPDGLMCIPPKEDNPSVHFAFLRKLAIDNSLSSLSMGMSSDYEQAIAMSCNISNTFVRVGSQIFGNRI